MSLNNKSDMSTSGSESTLFPAGPRGSAFLERPGGSRDSIANRIQSSSLGTTRSAAASVHGDPVGLVQSIISDVKPVVPEKLPRPPDMKWIMGSFAGISDDLGTGKHVGVSKEEVKRVRSRLAEGSTKANERKKTFDVAVSRIDKYINSNPRKRSRGESLSERPGGLSGPGISRASQQSYPLNADESEMGPPKPERIKNQGQNRRARTSIAAMDARNIGASRSSGSVDKTRDISKINNKSSGEEKPSGLTGNNSWEKLKMKKKRSVIKTDASSSVGLARSVDAEREGKQEIPSKIGGDARPKVTVPHSSRYGVPAGSSGRPDTEQAGLESPRPLPRGNQESGALSINKRDRLSGFEIGNIKAINKLTDQEGSPTTSVSRANTSIRGPRSTPAALPKASASMFRAPETDIWDQPSPINKSGSSAGGSSSTKRTKSALSPSPPTVTKWASQRPPKMSRVARRSNIGPITGSQGSEPQMPDLLENKNMAVASQEPNRIKKGDHAQSSSEESGAAVYKPKDNKRKRTVEVEENSGLNSQRLGTAGHPLKKSKSMVEDDTGEGSVRKQGRGGRGFAPPRPGRPSSVEKPEANGTTTKHRSARSGVEGRPGRPQAKKYSERRGKTRAREVAVDSPLDTSGQPEDDRETLLAAASAALAPGYGPTDILWKKNEPYFRSISDGDMIFLNKQLARMEEQIHCTIADEQDLSKKGNLSYVSLPSSPNGYGAFSNGEKSGIVAWQNDVVEPILEKLVQGMDADSDTGFDVNAVTSFSICQKLMSAIINEEELERIGHSNSLDSNILCIEIEEGWLAHQESERNQPRNGVRLDMSVDRTYEQLSIDDRILLELNQIGIYPDPCVNVPDLTLSDGDDIVDELAMLEAQLAKQALERKGTLTKIEEKAQAAKETQEREFSNLALDNLIIKANEKYLASRGKQGNRAARQSAMGLVNRCLARCKEFESNGTSCFDDVSFKELLHSSVSRQSDPTQNEEKSPQDLVHDKDEQWSTGVKKKELLLDDVVGNITGSVSLGSGAKGKRSERDSRGNNKNGRGSSSSVSKGERKLKAKPKQRSAPTSTSPANVTAELAPRSNSKREGLPPLPTKPGAKQLETEIEEELEPPLDLSGLPLPGLDFVGDNAGDDQDFWSGVDDGLQDADCVGLDIPFDDLSDLNFNFN